MLPCFALAATPPFLVTLFCFAAAAAGPPLPITPCCLAPAAGLAFRSCGALAALATLAALVVALAARAALAALAALAAPLPERMKGCTTPLERSGAALWLRCGTLAALLLASLLAPLAVAAPGGLGLAECKGGVNRRPSGALSG
jgi:hypothetical protein